MNQNNNNDLNKFFKSRLEDTTPADNGWNVPPMSLLDDALDQLPLPPKRNKLLIPFIVLGVIAFGLITLTAVNTLKISSLNGKVETMSHVNTQTAQDEVSTVNQKLEETVANTQPAITEEYSNNETEVNTPTEQLQTTNNNAESNSTIQSERQPSAKSTLVNVAQEPVKESENLLFNITPLLSKNPLTASKVISEVKNLTNSKKTTQSNPIEKENLSIANLPLLHALALLDSNQDQILLNLADYLTPQTTKEETDTKRKFALIITGGHLGTDIRMTNINPSSFTLTEYDNLYPGVGFKIGVSTHLSKKLLLSTTLGFNRLLNKSHYESDFIYNEDNTLPTTTGEMIHLSASRVETPIAPFSDELALKVNNDQIQNGENLDQVTEISDTYQVLQLSTSVSAELVRYKKFSLQSGIGISGNYIVDIIEALDTKMLSNSSIMMEKSIDINLTQDINRLYLSGSLKLGVKYDLSESIFLQLDSRYEKGLTSIRKQTSSELPKSYLNSLASEITLGYSF